MTEAEANGATNQRAQDQAHGAARTPASRRGKIILAIIGALIAVPVIALVVLLNYDWNKARPWLNAKTSEAIGRPFEIAGDLSLTWEKPAIPERDRTWRDAIPWPHLLANDARIGNPAGMDGNMAAVQQFSFSLNPFALFVID